MQIQEMGFYPYELILKEIEEGKLNPFDVNVQYLIELFEEKAKELEDREFFIEAGVFLVSAAKLLKLQLQTLFPEPKREKKRITIKEVKEVIEKVEEEIASDTLEWLYDYSPNVGRPKRSTGVEKPQKMDFKEFVELPLHKSRNVDLYTEARRVYEEIKNGTFKIKSWIDLLAFLYAYMEYEDLEVKDIKEFI